MALEYKFNLSPLSITSPSFFLEKNIAIHLNLHLAGSALIVLALMSYFQLLVAALHKITVTYFHRLSHVGNGGEEEREEACNIDHIWGSIQNVA